MTGDAEDRPHRRRPRYRGTHPRRFEDKYKERNPAAYPEMQGHVQAQGKTPAGTHVPILVDEVMDVLRPEPGDVVADGTLGYGGHARAFIERIGPSGRLVGFDVDAAELERTRQRLEPLGTPLSLHRMSFSGVAKPLAELGITGYDVLFADLGVSSMQIDDPKRGFSYKHDGPLDMRMDDRIARSAADLLRDIEEAELSEALRLLGDEPDHERIAARVARVREHRTIRRTLDLVEIIFRAKKIKVDDWRETKRPGDLHPAARTFQALRILVNGELSQLDELLRVAPWCLKPGGRFGVLSFHSGEDGRVIRAMREGLAAGLYSEISEHAIRPGPEEKHDNPRSRSAVFRWAVRSRG